MEEGKELEEKELCNLCPKQISGQKTERASSLRGFY